MSEPLFEVEVVGRKDLTEDLFTLDLKASGWTFPAWEPGAHIDIEVAPDDLRQYSLTGDSRKTTVWRLGIRQEMDGKGGSVWIHQNAQIGSKLRIGGPRNHFRFEESNEPVIFFAGGIGITPIVPMILAAKASRRPWTLHFVAATRANMPFLDEVLELGAENISLYPRDERDRPDISAILVAASAGVAVYACGPESMMEDVEAAGGEHGDIDVHVERFTPRDFGDERGLDEFEVEFEYSGKTVQIGKDDNILDAARAAGIEVISSCQEGTCGSCETPVMSGTPIHLDSVLSEKERQENKCMMICVSRSLTPKIVLDL